MPSSTRPSCPVARALSNSSPESMHGDSAIEIEVPISNMSLESPVTLDDVDLLNEESRRSSATTLASYDDDSIVCVVGVGYVGEMLLREFGHCYQTIGFDVSEERIFDLSRDFKSIPTIQLTTDTALLSQATHFLISVPTLLRPDLSINTSHLLSAIETVVTHARPGSTIVIESSVSVGMTRSLLSRHLLKFHCGMSPERVDPGRISPAPSTIPKIISGLTEESLSSIQILYSRVFDTIVAVSSPEVAEMTKLYENCFRMINIAFVNEIADACSVQGINAEEVVQAASTKPFGFMSFQPGLGVGGHCIPVNPHYLMSTCDLPLLKKATSQMSARPTKLAKQFYRSVAAKTARTSGKKPRVLIIGAGFKPGQKTLSHSPALQFAQSLENIGCADLAFYDPHVAAKDVSWMRKLKEKDFSVSSLDSKFDAIAVCMRQTDVDYNVLSNLRKTPVRWF